MLNFLRNVLTALWSVFIASMFGLYAALSYQVAEISVLEFEDYLPVLERTALIYAAISVSALLALIYVPFLMLSALVMLVGSASILMLPDQQNSAGLAGSGIVASMAIISILLVVWDVAYRRKERRKRAVSQEDNFTAEEFA